MRIKSLPANVLAQPVPAHGRAVCGAGLVVFAALLLPGCEKEPKKAGQERAPAGPPPKPAGAIPGPGAPSPESGPSTPKPKGGAFDPSVPSGKTEQSVAFPTEMRPKDPAVQALVRKYSGASESERAELARQLLAIDTTESVAGLMQITQGMPPGEQKSNICQGLSGMETREKREFLLGALPFVDGDARRALAQAMGAQADSSLISTLVERYDNSGDEAVRSSVLQVLRDSISADAVGMTSAIVNDPGNGMAEPMVRAAAEALARNASAPAVATLMRKLSASRDAPDSEALATLISGISNPAAQATLIYSARGNKDSPNPASRVVAIRALGNYPTLESLQAMRQLHRDADPAVQAASREVAQRIESIIGR